MKIKITLAVFGSLLFVQTVIGESIGLGEDPYIEQGSFSLITFYIILDNATTPSLFSNIKEHFCKDVEPEKGTYSRTCYLDFMLRALHLLFRCEMREAVYVLHEK